MNHAPTPLLHVLSTAAAALALASCTGGSATEANAPADRVQVQRGPMKVLVTQNGEIKAFKETVIRSEVEGQNTVIFLIPEGKEVKQGERLVEMDSSSLIERKAKQEIDLARAESTYVQAEKNLEIEEKQFEADKLDADNKVTIANLDLEKFLGKPRPDGGRDMGEMQQKTEAAESDIKLAESKLKVAKDKYEWSEKLALKDFVTKTEVERDKLDCETQETAVKLAKNKRDLLVGYEHKKSQIDLEQKRRDAQLERDRVRAKGEAKLAQALAEKKSRKSELDLAKERFDNLVKQVKNCVITAPTPGLVVYSQVGDRGMRSEFIAEGQQVRERQSLILLPDTTRMIVALKVSEAQIDKVQIGQPAEIEVETMNRPFAGHVRKVAPLPDSGSRWTNPDLKVFQVEVELNAENTGLKPGTSAKVSILVGEFENVIKVPIQAIERDGLVQYVWIETKSGPSARQVELGMTDLSFVEVKSGLDSGDWVFLGRPAGVTPPKFAQPKAPATAASQPTAKPGSVTEANARPGPGPAPRGQGQRGGGMQFQMSPEMQATIDELLATLKQKHPEFAEKLAGDSMALMRALRDEAIAAAIEADPELKTLRDKMRASMRGGQGGGRRGRGDGGEQGGAPREGSARGDGK